MSHIRTPSGPSLRTWQLLWSVVGVWCTACANPEDIVSEKDPVPPVAQGSGVCEAARPLALPPFGELGELIVSSWSPSSIDFYDVTEGTDCAARGDEAFFRFTIGESTRVRIEARSARDTVLGLLRGSCAGELAVISCDDDGGEGRGSLIEFDLQPEVDPVLVVDFIGAGATDVLLRTEVLTP